MVMILGVALAVSALILAFSIQPGLPSELGFFAMISAPLWLPAICLSWWTLAGMAREAPDILGLTPARWRWRIGVALLVLLNCGLLWCRAPLRLGFLHARAAFEAAVATAPPAYARGQRFDRRIGLYQVDRCAADPRGGIYFRTRFGPNGFHTAMISHGFAYRPNAAGSPFGDADYAVSHVVGDWYCFQASEH
jgi:hypothetical protein